MSSETIRREISEELSKVCDEINSRIEGIFERQKDFHPALKEAMKYMLSGGGKRVRPAVVIWSCELTSGRSNEQALNAGAALEMVHTYSLIHDDLPAMDNDDMRRGRASCHKAFDEATAILAGDALLTFAFEYICDSIDDDALCVKLVSQLSKAAGPAGMIAGQMADLQAENREIDRQVLDYIHLNKTAKMLRCASVMGGFCGGGSEEDIKYLSEYGLNLGLAFQIADDILDVSGSSEELGKTAGKDAQAGKLTYPALVGLEESRKIEKDFTDKAVNALNGFAENPGKLSALAQLLVSRTS
jgi:geranylgeranyl diphosphate synthase type II